MKQITIFSLLLLFSAFIITESSAQVKDDFIKDTYKPNLELAVLITPCVGAGFNLLVYNPYAKSALVFASAEYSVKWLYTKGGIVLSDKIVLPCVCDGHFTAIVTHLPSGKQKTISVYIPPCDMLAAPYIEDSKSQ